MLTLDIARDSSEEGPTDATLQRAAEMALQIAGAAPSQDRELSLRIVDSDEMRELNARYRGRDKTTNVLSFPADLPEAVDVPLLGDIVICAPVVRSEARQQGKPLAAHWDHMLIHGVLHLLGYDHETDREAEEMEALETRALQVLGWPCPYRAEPAPAAAGAAQ